ncbi:MAG: hypothetical protein JWO01_145 [Microbacteriaceae bacterium]|nr:hypothetical protein [Microbacteriaceae bacterium]
MTLTHIVPSLRRTIASPWGRDLWQEFTTTSTVDVTIACTGTTCLHEIDPNHLHRAATAVDDEKPVPPTSCGK